MSSSYEVFLTKSRVTSEEWQDFLDTLAAYHRLFERWQISIEFKNHTLRYFLQTKHPLPPNLGGKEQFLLEETPLIPDVATEKKGRALWLDAGQDTVRLEARLARSSGTKLRRLNFRFRKLNGRSGLESARAITKDGATHPLLFAIPAELLAVDFSATRQYIRHTPPVFLDIGKNLPLLTTRATPIVSINAFPYSTQKLYLDQDKIDWHKHSVVIGASGSGKSKFLSLLIEHLLNSNNLTGIKPTNPTRSNPANKVIVIDPHAALESDIGGLGRVIDFSGPADYIDLFSSSHQDVITTTELLLDVFLGLLAEHQNPRLERVLHHSIYLLSATRKMNFTNLRSLLLDSEFRIDFVTNHKRRLPNSIVEFFLTEYGELKTNFYSESIAPIITLIDEMELVPVFSHPIFAESLETTIHNHDLNIFSLNRARLGNRAMQTLSGLLLSQIFNLIGSEPSESHITLVVDEVAVIEMPILRRFLAEARKYNLSIILAGQYFGGISAELQQAIFANVANFCVFRVGKEDAATLARNLEFKIPLGEGEEKKLKLLTGLKDRECVLRLSADGKLLSAMKGRTVDFVSKPRLRRQSVLASQFATNREAVSSGVSISAPNLSANTLQPATHLGIGGESGAMVTASSSLQPVFSSASSLCLRDVLTLTSTARKSARELHERRK